MAMYDTIDTSATQMMIAVEEMPKALSCNTEF